MTDHFIKKVFLKLTNPTTTQSVLSSRYTSGPSPTGLRVHRKRNRYLAKSDSKCDRFFRQRDLLLIFLVIFMVFDKGIFDTVSDSYNLEVQLKSKLADN
jgi:hypothetical protein